MQKTRICIFVIAILLLTSLARADDVEGRWMVSLQDKQRTLVGLLEVEKAGNGWTAYFEGGPATVETDGDNVVIRADSRDIKGFVFDRKMIGKRYLGPDPGARLSQVHDGIDTGRRSMAGVLSSVL
jgi:hypothetical protein